MAVHHERLTLLYDGECPFCRREADRLRRADRRGAVRFEDISAPAFRPESFGVTREETQARLHAVFPDGRVVRAMDAIRAVYAAVGHGWLVAPTGWPGLRPLFDAAYRVFARNRVRWGRWLGRGGPPAGTARAGQCGPPGGT